MLPDIKHPLVEFEIPSKKKKYHFRPYLSGEEKILLMAGESNDDLQIVLSVKQIISNCYSDKEEFDVGELTSFDIVYLFLKLRSISVDNIMRMSYEDAEDGKKRDFELDIRDIEIKVDPSHSNIIQINDDLKMKLKYPKLSFLDDIPEGSDISSILDKIVIACIDTIYDSEKVYDWEDEEELVGFINKLKTKTLEDIKNFYNTMPKVEHEIKYVNTMGNEVKFTLSTLQDFFIWRSAT